MRYWWVNQNQTFRQEIEGGYLWSPKRNKNGNRNPFYEFMREVAPGDIVLSFCDTLFDKGFISFENAGQLIVSPVADPVSLKRMGIDRDARANVGAFSQGQRRYLEFHRENVLRMARGLSRGEHDG